MPGRLCPNCHELAFYTTKGENRKCSKCGSEMIVPIKNKGRGEKCSNCGRLTVQEQNGKLSCTSCGAKYIMKGK